MKQSAITIMYPILKGQEQGLEGELLKLGPSSDWSKHGFDKLDDLHFLSCCIIGSCDGCPAYAVLELNFDGSVEPFLRSLAANSEALLRAIFARCSAPPPQDRNGLLAYLLAGCRPYMTFHRGTPGRTVQQILL
jgi:hypothetical protein